MELICLWIGTNGGMFKDDAEQACKARNCRAIWENVSFWWKILSLCISSLFWVM